jgi:hypothetical protein
MVNEDVPEINTITQKTDVMGFSCHDSAAFDESRIADGSRTLPENSLYI